MRIRTLLISLVILTCRYSTAQALARKQHLIKRNIGYVEMLTEPQYLAKYILMLIIGLAALIIIKKGRMNKSAKSAVLISSLLLFGFGGNIIAGLGLRPTPVCAAVKPFIMGFRPPFVMLLTVIFLLTMIGPKLFCGWACPAGAAQELISMISDRLGVRRFNFKFKLSNSVRAGIMGVFLILSTASILFMAGEGREASFSIYKYINVFYGFRIESHSGAAEYLAIYLPLVLTLIAAVVLYRPYCHFICPVGLYTNLLEHLALYRVSMNRKSCNFCSRCIRKVPCKALPHILNRSAFRADCFSCGRCLEECPKECLKITSERNLRLIKNK